ncbi:UDP-N-acetylglucosamine 1-carboxyvinyltransferase, partial [Helicobacter pylori]|nr:UDP-N-acetylglucosamine 1-carboxyvinyltransferase [Helicobacter pylori]
MGNLTYYAYMYLILFVCLLPVLLVGLAWRLSRPPLKQNIPNKSLSLENLSEQIKNLKSPPPLKKNKKNIKERFKICPQKKK